MQVEEIVARLWPGERARVEPLGGGITNHNFKVAAAAGVYVLRIGGQDTELLGIDRDVEHMATRAAADVGVGPEVARYLEPEGYLVTRFIDGAPIAPEEMRRPENVARAAAALRAFHEGRSIPGRFDAFRVVERYRQTAAEHGVTLPHADGRVAELASEIERSLGARALAPCHNDLLNANFIDDGRSLRIVDWEYAGMGDVFFDLANFSVNHEFDAVDNGVLLESYFGAVRPVDAAVLVVMRFMSDFREAMWGVVQQGISKLDFDFPAYAGEHFARLERTAASGDFRDALETIRPV